MDNLDISTLRPNDNLLTHIGKNIWLMDDHRWAIYAWESQRKTNKYDLVHADFHWDAVYDFHDDPIEEQTLLNADSARIHEYLVENQWIRFDSFIAPAVRRGLFEVIHFFCKETEFNDIAIDYDLLRRTNTTQTIHESINSLSTATFTRPIIFDLCLDLFNHSDQWQTGELWTESEIREFLLQTKHIITAAEIVTVSLSFNYSGNEDDTRQLAKLILPILLQYRTNN
ncbi:UPF0489 family protein [Undibacterium sp. RuTC16W]|uniref:UPF0489 family protein n=1 Tax=Undibacterium sp. RuTC16W TaxID=3413048 RepID=UPI003BF40639